MQNSQQGYIDIHTHKTAKSSGIVVYNNFPEDLLPELTSNFYFSSGIHPWYLNDWELKVDSLLLKLNDSRVIAIGECGIDAYSKYSFDIQKKVFCLQIELSEKYEKPLIVHCVKAFNDLFQIRKYCRCSMPWVIHGFSGSAEIAQKCIAEGMFLSFGKHLFTQNSRFITLAKNIEISNVLLETDDSELSIFDVYKQFADIRQMGTEELIVAIATNFNRCFYQIKNL